MSTEITIEAVKARQTELEKMIAALEAQKRETAGFAVTLQPFAVAAGETELYTLQR